MADGYSENILAVSGASGGYGKKVNVVNAVYVQGLMAAGYVPTVASDGVTIVWKQSGSGTGITLMDVAAKSGLPESGDASAWYRVTDDSVESQNGMYIWNATASAFDFFPDGPAVEALIDALTATLSATGLAATATKLATSRTVQTNLASTASASFDGSANITPGVSGTLPIANGGTGATTAAAARSQLGVAASTDLTAHTTAGSTNAHEIGNISGLQTALDGKTTIISAGATIYVATTGSDDTGTGLSAAPFATIQKALTFLNDRWLAGTVTINVAAGTYSPPSTLTINHSQGSRINILGAAPIKTTVTAVGSATGSSGAWDLPVTLASVTGISVGMFIKFENLTGGTNPDYLYGFHKITDVNAETSTIAIRSLLLGTTLPSGAISGEAHVISTIIHPTSAIGWTIQITTALASMTNIAIEPYNASDHALICYGNLNGLYHVGIFSGNYGICLVGAGSLITYAGATGGLYISGASIALWARGDGRIRVTGDAAYRVQIVGATVAACRADGGYVETCGKIVACATGLMANNRGFSQETSGAANIIGCTAVASPAVGVNGNYNSMTVA